MGRTRFKFLMISAGVMAGVFAAAPDALAQKGPPQQAGPAQSAPLAQARPGETPVQQVTRLNAEGEAAFARRDYPAAAAAFEAVLSLYVSIVGANDPRSAMAAVNLGNALLGSGRYGEAETVLSGAEATLAGLGYDQQALASVRRALDLARRGQAQGQGQAQSPGQAGAGAQSRPASDPLVALNDAAAVLHQDGDLEGAEAGYLDVLSRLDAAGRSGEELAGVAWVNLGETYKQQARLEEAINAIERARAIFTALDSNHRYLAVVENNLASVRRAQGEAGQALEGYRSAYQAMARSFSETHSNTLGALGNYANALAEAGRGGEARALLEPTLAAFAATGEPETPIIGLLKSNLGEIYLADGRWSEASALQRAALDILDAHPDAYPGETAQVRRRYGRALSLSGRPAEAEQVLARSVTETEQVFGAGSQETITAQTMLASAIFDQARFDEAEALQRAALASAEALTGDGARSTAAAIESNLAGTLRMQGRYADAEALYRRSLSVAEADGDDISTAISLENLAGSVRVQGRLEDAAQLQLRAIGLYESAYGPDHPETIRAYGNAGTTLGLFGDYDEAERLMRLGLEGLERRLPDRHVMVLVARSNLAWLYLRHMDRPRDALGLYRAATGSIINSAYDDAALDDASGSALVRRRADIFTLHVEAAWAASTD
jgi:tetratricopeptide (TPR) repeat protein